MDEGSKVRGRREAWLRGSLPGIPPLLQPVAHSLIQAGEEVDMLMEAFPDELLWARPAGVASVGFHLQHLQGVVDRLFTYARGEKLDQNQLRYLDREGTAPEPPVSGQDLVRGFSRQVQRALRDLEATPPARLTESREVGREGLPSTVIGLYVHAAEHTTRHVGQLLVTSRLLLATKELSGTENKLP